MESIMFRKKNLRQIGKQNIEAFIEDGWVAKNLRILIRSPLAVYKNPPNSPVFYHLANILTVAMNKKWGSEEVYEKYRNWTARNYPIEEIVQYLQEAVQSLVTCNMYPHIEPCTDPKQRRMTDYYPRVSVDIENNVDNGDVKEKF